MTELGFENFSQQTYIVDLMASRDSSLDWRWFLVTGHDSKGRAIESQR